MGLVCRFAQKFGDQPGQRTFHPAPLLGSSDLRGGDFLQLRGEHLVGPTTFVCEERASEGPILLESSVAHNNGLQSDNRLNSAQSDTSSRRIAVKSIRNPPRCFRRSKPRLPTNRGELSWRVSIWA